MTVIYPSHTLSVSIHCPQEQVYDYIYDLKHLPEWAKSFCLSIRMEGDEGVMETPEGPATIRFVERNAFGLLDHDVTAAGIENRIPMRVLPNGLGSELIFTLFQQPGVTEELFADDVRRVSMDLASLKRLLEQGQEP